jgi:serine/threonine protein kinase
VARFGEYELISRLGEGGMAEVYRAVHVGPHGVLKPCVIKRIAERHVHDRRYFDLFLDEARVSVLLNHPNVVQTFELGEVEGRPFLAMELVDGTTVAGLLRGLATKGQGLPVGSVVEIGLGVARALDYAHRLTDLDGAPLSLTHRDVSPQNILVSREGAVKLADFGIARHELRAHVTLGPSTKGKLGYMAPEQALGGQVDGRADLFALGIVLAEMIGGLRVGSVSLVDAIAPRVRVVLEHAPVRVSALEALTLALVHPDPAQRPRSAAQLAGQLLALQASLPSPAPLSALVIDALGSSPSGVAATSPRREPATELEAQTWQDPDYALAVDLSGAAPQRLPPRVLAPQRLEPLPARVPPEPAPAPPRPLAPTGTELPMSELRAPPAPGPAPTWGSSGDEPLELAPRAPRPTPRAARGARDEPAAKVEPRTAAGLARGALIGLAVVVVGLASYALWPARRAPTGAVLVTSDPPGASVWLDDVDTGRVTPTELTGLTLGRAVRVAVAAPDVLPEPPHHLIEPRVAEELLSAPFVLWPSRRVRVDSTPPGARVTLDGRLLAGRTPLELPPLRRTQGATLGIEADAHLPLRVEVPTGTVSLVRVALERARGLVVTSVPEAAQVMVDGRVLGRTPTAELPVPAERPFVLRVSRAGYRAAQRTVDPLRLRGPVLEVRLEELPLLALPLPPSERARARELLAERRRLTIELLATRRRLDVARLALTRVARTRQRFVAPVVDAEAAVAQVEAALDDLKGELDRVEGELEALRSAAEGRE